MSDANFEFHPEWKDAIGRFIVKFAGCEVWISGWARELFPVPVDQLVVEQQLESRARFVRAAFKASDIEVESATLDDVFKRLKDLATYRNLVVHNPPVLAVYETTTSEELIAEVELVSQRDPRKQTTLAEIRARTVEADALQRDMLPIQREFALRRLKRSMAIDAGTPPTAP
jgi:hypothetical protein